MTTCGMRASTNQGTDKREKLRMHTESKIQGNNDASHRGQTNTASGRQRPEGYCLSQRRDNTASHRGGNTVSRRDRTTLSLAEGTQGSTKLLIPHHGTRDTIKSIRICWTLKKTKRREQGCRPIDSQLIGHFPPKKQTLPGVLRLHSGSL